VLACPDVSLVGCSALGAVLACPDVSLVGCSVAAPAVEIVVGTDAPDAAAGAAAWLARRIRSAVRLRGSVHVAFSGGTTPGLMVAALAAMDLPWGTVHAWQVDERVAPDGDPDRNSGLVGDLPVPRGNVHLMAVGASNLGAAAARYAAELPPVLDIVHLGLGDDGHTASWPPGDPVVDDRARVGLSGEYRGRVRMTLTPAAVNAARARLVLATGPGKAGVVERWLLGDPALPIQRVRRTGTTVVLDAAAAGRVVTPVPVR